jgi:hypothetical protein
MREFEMALYEGMLVSFGKVLAKYNAFAQGSILRDVGKEMIEYLGTHGFPFEETGTSDDLGRMIDLFVSNGFAERVDIVPMERGNNFVWHHLYGAAAYRELHEVSANPFLACPLNICLFHLAEKQHKSLRLLRKTFDLEHDVVESQYELVEHMEPLGGPFDPLVLENARLYELAHERAERLEKAMSEIKTLRGILPICLECKKIRNDSGFWQQVEAYIRDNSELRFSHGYCPDCAKKVMQDIEDTGNPG